MSRESYAKTRSHNKSTCSLDKYPENARISHLNAIFNLHEQNTMQTVRFGLTDTIIIVKFDLFCVKITPTTNNLHYELKYINTLAS